MVNWWCKAMKRNYIYLLSLIELVKKYNSRKQGVYFDEGFTQVQHPWYDRWHKLRHNYQRAEWRVLLSKDCHKAFFTFTQNIEEVVVTFWSTTVLMLYWGVSWWWWPVSFASSLLELWDSIGKQAACKSHFIISPHNEKWKSTIKNTDPLLPSKSL